MMRSKMLDRAEERGEKRGRSSCAAIVRLYNEGKDISWVAKATGEEESIVRATLMEAGMLPQ